VSKYKHFCIFGLANPAPFSVFCELEEKEEKLIRMSFDLKTFQGQVTAHPDLLQDCGDFLEEQNTLFHLIPQIPL